MSHPRFRELCIARLVKFVKLVKSIVLVPLNDSGEQAANVTSWQILLQNSVAGILAVANRNGIASIQGMLRDRANQFLNVVIDEFSSPQQVAEIAFAIIPRSFPTVSAQSE